MKFTVTKEEIINVALVDEKDHICVTVDGKEIFSIWEDGIYYVEHRELENLGLTED
jgi:hypothetical protein